MTYNVFSGTLNLTQSIMSSKVTSIMHVLPINKFLNSNSPKQSVLHKNIFEDNISRYALQLLAVRLTIQVALVP